MSIISSDSVGRVLLSWSAVVFVYGFDCLAPPFGQGWILHAVQLISRKWFQWAAMEAWQSEDNDGKEFQQQQRFCRDQLQNWWDATESREARSFVVTESWRWMKQCGFTLLISEILYCVECWCRWLWGCFAICASPVWFLWWMEISTCDRVGCSSHLDTQL